MHSRDAEPINGKFNIGRDTVTSDGYGIYVNDEAFLDTFGGASILSTHILGYGINKYCGCTFTLPIFLHQRAEQHVSRGLSDIQVSMQWHLYRTEDQILVFKTGLQFPTGDRTARPPLGTGSFNPTLYILGIHSSERLFADFVFGTIITTTRKRRNSGIIFDYHLSIGPKFPLYTFNDAEWYAFVELQGYYTAPSRAFGKRIPNTGGNLILFGPTISYDTNFNQVLVRFQIPISERQFGKQPKTNYFASFNFQHDI